MSEDRDLDTVVTVSADGISVEKRFERDAFAVPAVEFTVRSDREEPATVRLVDHVPEEFPMDSVGFHPDYENDNWTAFKDHRVEFEREFGPGEEVVTVYGVRLSETDDVADFLGDPELAEVAVESDDVPPDPLASIAGDGDSMDGNTITDIISEEGNQVIRDVLAGERDTLPGLDDEPVTPAEPGDVEPAEAGATDPAEAEPGVTDPVETEAANADPLADVGTAESADPLGEPAGESGSIGDPEPVGEAEPTVEPADVDVDPAPADGPDDADEILTAEPDLPATGNLASTLAEEIREGAVSDADLSVLRQELDVALPESTNVRIRHLQSRVEDLTAYTEALEGFIDENGTASQVFDEFEAFETEVSELNAELNDLEDEIDDVRGSEDERQVIEDLENTVATIQADQSETDERVAAVESEVESVSETLDETHDRLQDVHADLDGVRELDDEIASLREEIDAVADFEDRLDAIEELRTEVASVRTEFEELEELVGANTEDLTALDETLSNVEAELAGVTDVEGDLQSVDERLETLSENVTTTEQSLESAVEGLQSEVESITDDVEEIRAWRDQLKGVFGADEN